MTTDLFGGLPPPPPVDRNRNADGRFAPKGVCLCCGQKIRKLNPHIMCKQKVQMLEILGKANDWVKVHEGSSSMTGEGVIRAPYRARAHVSRLVWFGLAEHNEKKRSGLYRITPEGFAFLRGEHAVPDRIWCKDGDVIERGSVMVTIGSVKGVVLDKEYWDNYWREQKNG